MGQKIHPLGFRVNITQNHQSDWFAKTNHHPLVVMEDCFIRQFLFRSLRQNRITTIKINRILVLNQIVVEIITPELFHYDWECKKLKSILQSQLKIFRAYNLYLNRSSNNFKSIESQELLENKYPLDVRIESKLLRHKLLSASFYADFLVILFEKRTRSRQALKKVFKSYDRAASNPKINPKGIKIQISGRINGHDIARTEWKQRGRVPLHTLRADIDYSCKAAKTIYGILGVKVWLFREEIINHKKCSLEKETRARKTIRNASSYTKQVLNWNMNWTTFPKWRWRKEIFYYLSDHKEDLFTPDYNLRLKETIKENNKKPHYLKTYNLIPQLRLRKRLQQWFKKGKPGGLSTLLKRKIKKIQTKPLTQLTKPFSSLKVKLRKKQKLDRIDRRNRKYRALFIKQICQELAEKRRRRSKKKRKRKRRKRKSRINKEIEIK